MSVGRSRDDLLKFLDWMAEKGLLPSNTASSRKASSNKILALLSEEEAADVTIISVDDLVRRFGTKHGQQYSPDSLLSYKSRLRSAIDDFRAYCDNPVGFRPVGRVQQRARTPKGPLTSNRTSSDVTAAIERPEPVPSRGVHVIPVSIRPDLTIQIGNLPFDLTEAEAKRVANVIMAYAVPLN